MAFEGFAGVNVGPAKFKGGFQKVYSVSDGEGDSFDLNVKDKNIWYFETEYKGGKFAAKHEKKAAVLTLHSKSRSMCRLTLLAAKM